MVAATRRISRINAGIALLVAGVAMLVLPGPGIITILAGIAVLAGKRGKSSPPVAVVTTSSAAG